MSIDDYVRVFENIIHKYTLDEIRQMVTTSKDKDGKPINALIAGLCLAWLADCKRGMSGGGVHQQMMDRKFGKPKESIDLHHSGGIDVTAMTPEERRARIKELEAKRREREQKDINDEPESQR